MDPYVARELHLQEVRDKELRDVLDALFGTDGIGASDCVTKPVIGASDCASRHGATTMRVANLSAPWVAAADRGDTVKPTSFLEAFRAIDRLKERGPVKVAKAWALFFVLGCRVYGAPLPTKGRCSDLCGRKSQTEDIATA